MPTRGPLTLLYTLQPAAERGSRAAESDGGCNSPGAPQVERDVDKVLGRGCGHHILSLELASNEESS
jgi:hypothetical protein